MYKLLIMFIFHCSSLIPHCFSQSITWQRVYNINIAEAEAYDICEADGNNFYVAGAAGAIQQFLYVLKINQYGDTIWVRNYGGGRIYAVAPSGDGGCVFAGDPSLIFKIKPNGDTAWKRFYAGGEIFDLKKTIDGGYIACGNSYIRKIDSLGNLQWERYYQGFFVCIDIAVEGNGYVLLKESPAVFLKINNSGDTVWQKGFSVGNNAYLRSFSKRDFGYVLAGHTSIYPHPDSLRVFTLKTDLNGNLLLSKIYESNYQQFIHSIVSENNNKFYVSFWTNTENWRKAGSKVISIDSSLSVLKEITILPDTFGLALFSIFKVPNSTDIIGCGRTDQFQTQGNTEMYAVRLDSALNPPPHIGIRTISNNNPEKYNLYQNYPNPFNPVTRIKFNIPSFIRRGAGVVILKVFDVIGREIMTLVNEQLNPGTYEVTWDATNFSSGVYFYSLETKEYRETRKMVVIK